MSLFDEDLPTPTNTHKKKAAAVPVKRETFLVKYGSGVEVFTSRVAFGEYMARKSPAYVKACEVYIGERVKINVSINVDIE